MSHRYMGRAFQLLVAAASAVILMVAGVLAAFALPEDGRINIVHHFGGDALYCVDNNMNPSDEYLANDFAGMRLLSINGDELWSVDAATVADAVAQAQAMPGTPVLVLEAPSSYGMSTLQTYVDGNGDIHFIFTANDEHGKSNRVEFNNCEPVGAPGDTLETPVPTTIPTVCPPFIFLSVAADITLDPCIIREL